MSLAIFGWVRSGPMKNERCDPPQPRAAERTEIWSKRFERLNSLLEQQQMSESASA